MIPLPAAHPAFAPDNPYLQIAWDATSLELFMRDPWTYYCTIIEGWRTPLPNAAQLFGSLLHESCGVYCHHVLERAHHEAALDRALEFAIRKAAEGATPVGAGRDSDAPGQSWTLDELAANSLRKGDLNTRDLYRLLRAVVWWCDEYGQDPRWQPIRLPSGRPAIEVHFDLPLGFKIGGHDARLCGHMDGHVWGEAERAIAVREWKHTTSTISGARKSASYYFQRYKPNVQINTYALAGKLMLPRQPVRGVLVEACQTAVGFTAFEREWIERSDAHCDEWVECIRYQTALAEGLAIEAIWQHTDGGDPALPYARAMNPATMRQYGNNVFADAAMRLPSLRRQFLASQCVHGVRWNPTEARELEL